MPSSSSFERRPGVQTKPTRAGRGCNADYVSSSCRFPIGAALPEKRGRLVAKLRPDYLRSWLELVEPRPAGGGRLIFDGGPGIRTQKSLRTPVFKTGAIAILPTL